MPSLRPTPRFVRVPFFALLVLIFALTACRDAAEDGQSNQETPAESVERNAYSGPEPAGATARLGRGEAAVLQVSPDGRYLAVGGEIGLYLYDVNSFADVWQLASATPISAVAFSPDGRWLAAGTDDGGLSLVDVAQGIILESSAGPVDQLAGIYSLAWAMPDGESDAYLLAAGFNDGTVLLSNVAVDEDSVGDDGLTVEVAGPLARQEGGVTAMAFDPEGILLAAGDRSGQIDLYNTETMAQVGRLEGHEADHALLDLAWAPDGRQLASTALDGALIIWEAQGQQPLQILEHESLTSMDLAYSSEGDRLRTIWGDGQAEIYDAGALEDAPAVVDSGRPLVTATWLPSGSGWIGVSTAGQLWLTSAADDGSGAEVEQASGSQALNGHSKANLYVTGEAWSPDGTRLATSQEDTVIIWDLLEGQPAFQLDGHEMSITSIAWSPDGQTLATGDRAGKILLWQADSGQQRRQLTGHENLVADLAWSPDGQSLASAGSFDNEIIIWDAESGQIGQRLTGESGLWSLAWSPDGQQLAAGTTLGAITIWELDPEPAEQVSRLRRHTDWISALAWSPDGQFLASVSSDRRLLLTDLANERVRAYVGHTAPILDVAFSHDGSRLASTGKDRLVIIWDAAPDASTEPLTLFAGHNGGVNAAIWSPDDSLVASAADDGTIIIWSVVDSVNGE